MRVGFAFVWQLLMTRESRMTEGSIASQHSLKELVKSLHKELSAAASVDSSGEQQQEREQNAENCLQLIRAVANSHPPPSSRTAAMDKLLVLAKRKASSSCVFFHCRANAREFRASIAAIEKSLLRHGDDNDDPSSSPPADTNLITPSSSSRTGRSEKSKVGKATSKTETSAKPKAASVKSTSSSTAASTTASNSSLPLTVAEYLDRLKRQSKDLYKNPPALPPPSVTVYEDVTEAAPRRCDKSGRFAFVADGDAAIIIAQFRPNRSPEEILRGGAFGGTYFRTITSAVTNQHYVGTQVVQTTLPASWCTGLDEAMDLTSSTYRAERNKFNAKCGGSLGMWESSGWISDIDPYGWFQWYCRFFQGRRTSDDVRQVQRWLGVAGPKGRFKSQLCNKILTASTTHNANDHSISPVIRQTLWHWGLEITAEIIEDHQASRR
jgi:hypothetical protein